MSPFGVTLTGVSYCFLPFSSGQSLAQLGKDGAKTVTAAGTIVNEYTTLTADALAGTSMLTVTSSSLNANGRFPAALAPGDLVLIIQIQGASMTSPDDSTYGTIISMGNCGRQELAEVAAVPTATSIQLSCALQNSYTWVGRAQVVRVPRYASITINSGGILTCPNWNGSTGGVLALEVQGNTVINSGGRIDVTGLGFRGGQLLDNNSWYGVGEPSLDDRRLWCRKAKASWVTRSITICSEDVTVVARRSTPVAAGTDTMLAAAAAVMPATLQPGPAAEIRMFRTPPGRQPGISSIAALPVLHLPVEVAEVIRLAAPTRMRFHSDPSIVPGAATSVETMAAWVVVRWITRPAGFSSAAAGLW